MEIETTRPLAEKVNKQFSNEAQIKGLIVRVANGIEAADIDAIMSAYAPEAEIFDVRDSLAESKDEFRFSWKECFDMTENFKVEAHELKINVDNFQAFSHCLSHATGKSKDGMVIDMWLRITTCYSKIDGEWLIVHEHASMPGDFESGKILQNIKPIFFVF